MRAPIIGRERELRLLEEALGGAVAGRGSFVLLAGEPGIGKSRLCEESAVAAEKLGMRVVWGRAWEEGGAPAYWPWIQVLRGLRQGIDEREVKPDRPYKSVSAERTFEEDLKDPGRLAAELERIAGYAWDRVERAEVAGRTVTLKVKFGDFTIITRSKSFGSCVADLQAFTDAGQALLSALHPLPKGIRLLGLGLHNLCDEGESAPLQLGLAI